MPVVISCPDTREVEAIVQGPATAWDVERLARHLEGCPRCADLVDKLLDGETFRTTLPNSWDELNSTEAATVASLIARVRELRCDASSGIQDQELGSPSMSVRCGDPVCAPTMAELESRRLEDWRILLAAPQEQDELGRIGPYGIIRALGAGGMGVVLEARQTHPRRLVALKMILAGPRSGRQWLARFHSETEVIARLQHPNIVQIYDVGEHQGRPYFTMEHMNGGSLAQKLAGAPLPARAAAELVRVVALAVQHAHERGFVHRDLKPANILLHMADGGRHVEDKPGSCNLESAIPKIADFGLARQLHEDSGAPAQIYRTATGMILGTPAYMAPEQATGQGSEIGPATDVYALGVILYEALTGRAPFKAASVLETLDLVCSQEPLAPGRLQPGVPRDLQTVCLRCLLKEPARRYASAQDLADDLARFLDGVPIRARPVSARERFVKWARRRPALAALIAVSCASLLVGLIGGIIFSSRLHAEVQRANAEKAHARANFRKANEAVKRMLTQVGFVDLADVPELQEIREPLLNNALSLYRDLVADEAEPDIESRLDHAQAFRFLGELQKWLERRAEAAASYRQALTILEPLAASAPDRMDALREQAEARTQLALVVREPDEARALYQANELSLEPLVDRVADLRPVLAKCYAGHAQLKGLPLTRSVEYMSKAVGLQERVCDDSRQDQAGRFRLASYVHDLGQYLYEKGQAAEAEKRYHDAIAILEAMPSPPGHYPHYAPFLAETYNSLGVLCTVARRLPEAEQAYKKSLALREEECRWFPRAPALEDSLARALHNFGEWYPNAGRAAEGEPLLLRALAIREARSKKDPENLGLRSLVADEVGVLGMIYLATGRWQQARASYEKAIGILESVRAKDPEDARYAWTEGTFCARLAELLHWRQQPEQSLAYHDRAIATFDALHRNAPDNPQFTRYAQQAHRGRAVTLGQFGRARAALTDLERALELAEEPVRNELRILRALTLIAAGEYRRAVAEVETLSATPDLSLDDLYNLACVYTRSIKEARHDTGISKEQRAATVKDYADNALEILRRLSATGYFKDAGRREQLRTDPDLEPLRDLEAFRTLLAGAPTPKS